MLYALKNIAKLTIAPLLLLYNPLICGNTFAQTDANSNEKHILVLHSYHQGLEWTDHITDGIQSVFNQRPDVNLIFEYLDTKRNSKTEYHEALLNLYNTKTNRIPFEAIIVSDNAAFDFMMEYGNKYYPNTPVLYCGVNNLDTTALNNHPNFYGIGEKADHWGTISSIQKIFPKRNNVLIINDNTLTGKAIKNELDEELKKFDDKLNFEILSDFTIESAKEKVRSLDDSYVIYLLVVNRDKNGNFISYRNGITQIRSVSNVPIFGSWDFYEGKGLFGGKITRGFDQGEHVARLAETIIDKGHPLSIPRFNYIENNYVFDYCEMKSFGIKERSLPKNSKVFNKPKRQEHLVKFIITIQVVLTVIVLALIIGLRIRRKQKDQLSRIVEMRTAELSKANKELEDIILKKDKFFSILAHDLRNQIGSFLNASILLNKESFNKKADKVKLLHVALLQNANLTSNLLEDLLFWGMRQFGKSPRFMHTRLNLNHILEEIVESLEVNTYKISFEFTFNEDITINGDPQIIKFIIRNIVHNALKYSHEGEKVELRTLEIDKNRVSVSVKDYGIGMSDEVIESIYKGNPIRKQGEDVKTSTGLGLPTALEYLKELDGTINIESEPDKGSTFTLTFMRQ